MPEKQVQKIPSVNEVMEKNLPEKKFRAGAVSATIWLNKTERDGNEVEYTTISFERSYKDKSDKWQTTNHLRINDLPKAQLVLQKAYEFLVLSKRDMDV
ncbi:hypothetical protein JW949_04635 [Candidatus Woesearchaeota archaeon]|nr:hypothetical protein [Candidatus Woesearchaeota archaeon]